MPLMPANNITPVQVSESYIPNTMNLTQLNSKINNESISNEVNN